MTLLFQVAEFGRSFATRGRGGELRDELVRRLEASPEGRATIDFDGVTAVSYSFADEFVGMLVADDRVELNAVNMSDTVARVVGSAIQRRADVSVAAPS